eukprot:16098040-Heterocapsa_arctica.AAC.1
MEEAWKEYNRMEPIAKAERRAERAADPEDITPKPKAKGGQQDEPDGEAPAAFMKTGWMEELVNLMEEAEEKTPRKPFRCYFCRSRKGVWHRSHPAEKERQALLRLRAARAKVTRQN